MDNLFGQNQGLRGDAFSIPFPIIKPEPRHAPPKRTGFGERRQNRCTRPLYIENYCYHADSSLVGVHKPFSYLSCKRIMALPFKRYLKCLKLRYSVDGLS